MGLFDRLKDWMLGAPEEEETYCEETGGGEAVRSATPAVPGLPGVGRVVAIRPGHYVDAGKLADYLCQGYTVLLDLEEVSKDGARRIVDFLSGSAYAKDGQLLHIACNAYLLAPFGVDVLDFTGEQPPEEDDWTYDEAFGF